MPLKFIRLLFCLCLCLPTLAFSQTTDQKIAAAWDTWVSKNRIKHSTLTITHRGKHIRTIQTRSNPIPLASLSKAITAACTRLLISAGNLTPQTPLSDVFSDAKYGLAADSRVASITIAQLLSQSSGLRRDDTQIFMSKWRGTDKPRHMETTLHVIKRAKRKMKTQRFTYNNENYAILGQVIAEVTNQPYGAYCNSKLLKPMGITSAKLGPKYGPFTSFGGWSMTSEDYAKFVHATFGPKSKIGKNPSNWPHIKIDKGAFYGMGTFYRKWKSRHNFWHFGGLCFGSKGSENSYFASWNGEWAVVAGWNACLKPDQLIDLDTTLAHAALNGP